MRERNFGTRFRGTTTYETSHKETTVHRSSENYRTLAILILKIGLAALLLITGSAWAQSFRGSIRGTVTDPSGSVIVGATVTAKNISTGLRREATTSADGAYVLAELPAGESTVMAESADPFAAQ